MLKKSMSVLLHEEMIKNNFTSDEIEGVLKEQAIREAQKFNNDCDSCGKYAEASVTKSEDGAISLWHFGLFRTSCGKSKCCKCQRIEGKQNVTLILEFNNYNKCLMAKDLQGNVIYHEFFNTLTYDVEELRKSASYLKVKLGFIFSDVRVHESLANELNDITY